MSAPEDLISQIDEFHKRKLFVKVYEMLKEAYSKYPKDPAVVWRFARATYEFSEERPVDLELKETNFKKSFELIKEALALDANNSQIHKWYSICLAGADEYASQKDKILHAFDIKQHAMKALELEENPDYLTYYVLGRWCFTVSNVGWFERKLAQSLIADPPESSFEEALAWYIKAHDKEPKDAGVLLAIGDTYYAMTKYKDSKMWYEKAVEAPQLCINDGTHKEKARLQLQNVAGY